MRYGSFYELPDVSLISKSQCFAPIPSFFFGGGGGGGATYIKLVRCRCI